MLYTISMTKWHDIRKHPCLDCKKQVSYGSIRCASCHAKHLWKTGKMQNRCNSRPFQSRELNHNWKGGRIPDGYGYILIKQRGHHRTDKGGYVREHILVWEKINNKPLPKGWVIHHLNGIRDDNSPCNLLGMPDRSHRRILQAKAKRIQELEAQVKGQTQLL